PPHTVGLARAQRNRQTYVWIDHEPVLPAGGQQIVDFNSTEVKARVREAAEKYDSGVYCVAAAVELFKVHFGGLPVRHRPGVAQDDGGLGAGVWSGWGRPSGWPRARDLRVGEASRSGVD